MSGNSIEYRKGRAHGLRRACEVVLAAIEDGGTLADVYETLAGEREGNLLPDFRSGIQESGIAWTHRWSRDSEGVES